MELFDTSQYAAAASGGMKESFKTKRAVASAIALASRDLKWPENYHIVNSEKKLQSLAQEIAQTEDFFFDCETSGLNAWRDKLYCISFWVGDQGYLVPLEHRLMACMQGDMVAHYLKDAFASPYIRRSNHNIKFDGHFVQEQLKMDVGEFYCDTLVQSQVLNPDTTVSHGLKELTDALGFSVRSSGNGTGLHGNYTAQFGKTAWSHIEPRLAAYYAIEDTERAAFLRREQSAALQDNEDFKRLHKLFWELEMPMVNLTYRMEQRGVRVDQKYMHETLIPTVYTEWRKAIEELRPMVEPYIGYCGAESVEKALESPSKLEKIFFDKLDVPLIKHVTLKRGPMGEFNKRSLDKEAIAGLQKTCEPMRLLGAYRKWATVKKMFADALPGKIVDGRVHPSMNVIGAGTGRMSVSEPNLQQIPSRMGPLVRNAFIPEPGYTFMSADFSGQEMRILAHYSKEPSLIKLYTTKGALDIYSQTALLAFSDDDFARHGLTKARFEKMPKNERKNCNIYKDAKSLVLGLGYGMGPNKYARNTGKTLAQGKKDYAGYYEGFPRVGWYQKRIVELAKQHGYVTTLLGRRRPLPFINSTTDGGQRGNAERAAMNTPIQGTAADMVKSAAVAVDRLIAERGWPIRIALMIHDEILYEMPSAWAKANPDAIIEITDTMCNALPLNVPMESSATFEPRWGSEMDIDDLDDTLDDMAA